MVHLEEGEAAPFHGRLMNDEAVANIIVGKEMSVEQCEIQKELAIATTKAELQLEIDYLKAELETEIVQYVNDSGWLNGSLKPKPKVKLSSDEKVSVKIKRLQDNIKHWETKVKRANTYLKTYRYKLKRYKRTYSDKF